MGILTSVKKVLGIGEDYTHFDEDLIMHINSVFMILNQIGVGPVEGFVIEDDSAEWSDFTDDISVESLKTYVCMKVRMIFDPPTMSSVAESYNNIISELEWRLLVQARNNQLDEQEVS